MKKTSKSQSTLSIATIALGLVAVPMTSALADNGGGRAVEPTDAIFGMTYGDWGAAWWQWVLSIPSNENPLLDNTGANCAVGQSSGPVFYTAHGR